MAEKLSTPLYRKPADKPKSNKDVVYHKFYKFRNFVFRPADVDSWYQLVELDEDDEEKINTVVNHKGYSVHVPDDRDELFNWLCHHFSPTHINSTDPDSEESADSNKDSEAPAISTNNDEDNNETF